MAYNLLQIHQCYQHVVIVRLWVLTTYHYVAWDGSTKQDCPKSMGVNNSSDHDTSPTNKAMLERILHKILMITHVYELDGETRKSSVLIVFP